MADKNFNKIHKLYKDIIEVERIEHFIKVIIQLPISNYLIGSFELKSNLQDIYKVNLKLISFCVFDNALYINYEVV